MFSLPLYVYLSLLIVGLALLVARKYAAASRADGSPVGGSVRTAAGVEAFMVAMGFFLVAAAVVFGFSAFQGEVLSLLDSLLGVAGR